MKISFIQYLPADVLIFEDEDSDTAWHLEFNEMDTRTTRSEAAAKIRALADLLDPAGVQNLKKTE